MPASATAIYLRVSTDEQSTKNQRPDIDAVLTANRLTPDFIYEESASAAKHRPAFCQLMADAQAGKFSVLVIWALDRFGRNMAGNVNDVLALDRLGVRLISVKEPWMDTAGPVRELLIAIFSWAAQQERARLIERTKAGLAVARAKGKRLGRPSRGMVSDPQSVIRKWRASGGTYRELADALGGVSTRTAWKLANSGK